MTLLTCSSLPSQAIMEFTFHFLLHSNGSGGLYYKIIVDMITAGQFILELIYSDTQCPVILIQIEII